MKLPLPQRGQPLDVAFIYDLVNSVNQLWSKLTVSVSAYASLWTVGGRKNIRNSEVKIVTGYYKIGKTSVDSAGAKESFEYYFDIAFKSIPVVVATAIATEGSSATSKSGTATITSVTTNMVKGTVRFDDKGTIDMGVNIIAIGEPV